jgi:hypothetical protein
MSLNFLQTLSVFFKLQAMFFLHVFDGVGVNLPDEFIRLSHQLFDTLGFQSL